MKKTIEENWHAELLALYDGKPIPTLLLEYLQEQEGVIAEWGTNGGYSISPKCDGGE